LAEVEQFGFPGVASAADLTPQQRSFFHHARAERARRKSPD